VCEYTDATSSVVKRMQREGDSSPPSSAEFDLISTIQYSFRARCLDIGMMSKVEVQSADSHFCYTGCTEGSGDQVLVVLRNLPTRILA
jgi:hypothetical protein